MPLCPQCHAIPGERHTYRDNGQPCAGSGKLNPITKADTEPVVIQEA